jgi:hypothetical protein
LEEGGNIFLRNNRLISSRLREVISQYRDFFITIAVRTTVGCVGYPSLSLSLFLSPYKRVEARRLTQKNLRADVLMCMSNISLRKQNIH